VCKTIKDQSIKNDGEPGFTNPQISADIVSAPEIYKPEFFKELGWKSISYHLAIPCPIRYSWT